MAAKKIELRRPQDYTPEEYMEAVEQERTILSWGAICVISLPKSYLVHKGLVIGDKVKITVEKC